MAALLALLAGCQSYPFVYQKNQRVGARDYRVQVTTEGKTDVLFVIDNSGSMAEEQAELKRNIARFIGVLTRSVNEYQVGVISTDVFRRPSPTCDPCCDRDTDGDGAPDWSDCDDGRLIAADARTRIFRRPHGADAATLEAEVEALVLGFDAVVTSLGTEGNAFEVPFTAVRRALDPNGEVAVRALNHGFLREDADLALIFLSDEDECSYPADWYAQESRDDAECYSGVADALPVGELLDFLTALKGDVRRLRAAAIIGATPSAEPARTLGFAASGCATADAPSEPTHGEATGACGCWSARYLPDRRPGRDGDFYCNYMSDPPFSQPGERLPDLGNNQGGCIALPGSRYIELLETLQARRAAVGEQKGVLVDSICRADYGETLEQIALEVVVNNCFELTEVPEVGMDKIVMLRNGDPLERVERGSAAPGWSYDTANNEICLEGGVVKEVGDVFVFQVVFETVGFDE